MPEPGRLLDLDACFGRRAPVELEIGCGKGSFLVLASEMFPEVNFVGIELARPFARAAAARVVRRNLANARVLCGDAGRLIRDSLAPETLSAVHIYFPDPWPKKRHEKRRLLTPGFVEAVARVLEPDGLLCFATDHAETYERTITIVQASGSLEPLTAFDWSHERGITNFEPKYLREGRTSYRASFRRFSPTRDAERL
jgi:tRNA (guanine-N7-)-methyltransferase